MESSEVETPSLENMDCFMVITPIPQIMEDIIFENVLDIETGEIDFLNEARKELNIALTKTLGNVKLCINTATEYLDKLTTALAKCPKIKTKKSVTIHWGRIFTELGKNNVKIKVKEKDHFRVDIYMVMHTLAMLHKTMAEKIMCGTSGDEYEDLKDRVKEACNHIKDSVSMIRFCEQERQNALDNPIDKKDFFFPIFRDYNRYLNGILDLTYHMIQVEYPFEKKAYELAAKIWNHNAIIIEDEIKPTLKKIQGQFSKEKEIMLNLNFLNILQHMSTSIKWLCRGLSHDQEQENRECYSAINESKNCGQNCYDFFEEITSGHKPYYYEYVERWMNYIAKLYEYYKERAWKVDVMDMNSSYTGPLFESEGTMEKKEKIKPYVLEQYEEAFK